MSNTWTNRAASTVRVLTAGIVLALAGGCTSPGPVTDGGGTRGGNPVVTGSILGFDGKAARNVRVVLIAVDYNPVADEPIGGGAIDTTDSAGSYSVRAPDTGLYNICAADLQSGDRYMKYGVKTVADSISVVAAVALCKSGIVRIPLSPMERGEGFVYVPGTTIAARLTSTTDTVVLDSVPAGTLPVIYYNGNGASEAKPVRYAVEVQPGAVVLVNQLQWTHCRTIVLNTSASGAGVSGNVVGFPVLVRLTKADFNFSQALPGGADLLFTGAGGTALPSAVERWDTGAGNAEVWVRVDTVFGNDSGQSIQMYWGNTAPPASESGSAVFDTANGFGGVWHLGDSGADTVRDATANGFSGVSPDTAQPEVADGIIGKCRMFDGVTDYITMPGTADGKLDFNQNGAYSVSVWVMADSLTGLQQTLVSKGRYQYFLWIDSTFWQFWEYQDRQGWEATAQKAAQKQWVLLTGVRDGAAQYLYVNGERVDSVSLKSDFNPRNTGNDLILGRVNEFGVLPGAAAALCWFRGKLDEVRISGTARSPDWIRLCYMNQRIDDRLVTFR
jgi:hypothetical protein